MNSSLAEITARPIDLSKLLDGVDSGAVVLPDFQRSFQWSEGEVASLLATALMGWPAGSLLLMRGRPAFFNTRPIEGVARPASQQVTYVVLDGQQRLTALHMALRRDSEEVYVLDLAKLAAERSSAEGIEEAIDILTPSAWEIADSHFGHDERLLVPLTALSSASAFFEWRDAAILRAPKERRDDISATLTAAYRDRLGTISHYEFPSVVLENDLPSEAVARIFERINRGGMQLTTFDLLVARAYTQEWNLRTEWEREQEERPLLSAYLEADGLPVLQTLALRSAGDVRRAAVLNLTSADVQGGWDSAAQCMEKAINFVIAAGMRNPDWMPYRTLLLPLAALALTFELEEHRELLDSWLWWRSLNLGYDVASSTRVAADYRTLSALLRKRTHPAELVVDIGRLASATRRDRALWRAFLSLLLRHGAVDIVSGTPLSQDAPIRDAAVATLFARSLDSDETPHLSVLSQVLVDRRAAPPRARSRAIIPILAAARGLGGDGPRRLETQLIDPSVLDAGMIDPAEIMKRRLAMIEAYLASDLPLLSLRRQDPGTELLPG